LSLLLLPASTADAGEGPRSSEISQNGSIVVDTPLKLKNQSLEAIMKHSQTKKYVQLSLLKIIYLRTKTN
jgi:hypothetical protein